MLSWMAREFFLKSPVLLYPLVALGVFLVVFVGVSIRVFLTNQRRVDYLSRLPFNEDGESI